MNAAVRYDTVLSRRCQHGHSFNCRECWPSARAALVTEARIGDKVTSVCGPGESAELCYAQSIGTVYGIVRDRWGVHCRVKWIKSDGSVQFDSTHTFTLVGIGCYLHRDGLPVIKFGRGA